MSNSFTLLQASVTHDNDKLCDLLLLLKANPAVQHPLKKCVIWTRPKCCEVLIRHGADRLLQDEHGKIPFDYLLEKMERLRRTGDTGAGTRSTLEDDADELQARNAAFKKDTGALPMERLEMRVKMMGEMKVGGQYGGRMQ